jgi:hypothetical protein
MKYKATALAAMFTLVRIKAQDGALVVNESNADGVSCRNIIDNGWKRMPDVADYVLTKPGSNKLG